MVTQRRRRINLPEYVNALEDNASNPGKTLPCFGRYAEFVDYGAGDVPTEEEARALCAPCPIIDLCYANARHRGEVWGVWGGRVLGRPKKNKKKSCQ